MTFDVSRDIIKTVKEERRTPAERKRYMCKNYEVYTTKEKIIERANENYGGFVNTNGAWCLTRTPEQFKEMLEHFFGFEVIECKSTDGSSAIATTKCGLQIAWNGHCIKL